MKRRILLGALGGLGMVTLVVVGALAWYIHDITSNLPNARELSQYKPAISTRVFDKDGNLIAEFAAEKRIFTPITLMPDRLVNAFLAAEDKNFYDHKGLDMLGIARAVFDNVGNVAKGERLVGASTITQQVAKNLLLTNEVSFRRKIGEAFLAHKIEQNFSKQEILELYLNAIFLGQRSYGVTSAARTYFGKPLDELSLAECAYLAALPKAPSNYHPKRQNKRATIRRNWVLDRMVVNGYATDDVVEKAKEQPLIAERNDPDSKDRSADYFVEEVRRQLIEKYGETDVYEAGLIVHTTLDASMQKQAVETLRKDLERHDRARGWRGATKTVELKNVDWQEPRTWQDQLKENAILVPHENWKLAMVLNAGAETRIGFADGMTGILTKSSIQWANAGKRLIEGDLIYVQPSPKGHILRQTPELNGAIVALEPDMGRVRAMVGGYSFVASSFNRATQAWRQPGSSFKPFVFAAALENGYTPATVVNDAPFVAEGANGELYQPENYDLRFLGPLTLRVGIEKSRNAMTVRLAQAVGMQTVVDFAKPYDISPRMLPVLANSLGSAETTPLRITAAYATFPNGGLKVSPNLIERIVDRRGKVLFRLDSRECPDCNGSNTNTPPHLKDDRQRVMQDVTAYQITSMMRDVVRRGTATVVKQVGKPIAGKTGTTNDYKDAWFVGFSQDLVASVFVGYDQPRTMGRSGSGGTMAAPIFTNFMSQALRGKAQSEFRPPNNITTAWIEPTTGLPTIEGYGRLEVFAPGTEPGAISPQYIGGEPLMYDPGEDDPLLIGSGIEPFADDAYGPPPGPAIPGQNGPELNQPLPQVPQPDGNVPFSPPPLAPETEGDYELDGVY